MKRLIFVLSSLLVLPAFAEIAPEYYYEEMMAQYANEMPEEQFVDEEVEVIEDEAAQEAVVPVTPTVVSPRNITGRATTSRAITSSATQTARNVASRNVSNATTARTVSTRTATTPRTNTATSTRGSISRSGNSSSTAREVATTTVSNRPSTTVSSTGTTSQPGLTTRSSSNSNTPNTARSSIIQTDTVNSPLYISSSGRVSVNNTANVATRVPTIRVGSASTLSTTTTSESTSSTTSIDELAQLTDYCKAQYVACMDNFCDVLDDNQGRCSCSANLADYAETEAALKQATENLQEVALQIQYIGLTSEQVESLFTQTEAELEMQTTKDTSQLKDMLDEIKDMIVDVKTGSTSSNSLSLDLSGLLEFTIDSTGFDLTSFFGMTNNTDSISNQRGEQLYKTASARCKSAVLNSCAAQGVDITVITNSYDLEIDKACIAYERSLTDSNDQMTATVRNAKSVLQRARLLVAQQKNAYDLRECITELDSCMQNEFVCGENYENCLDPSGKYIVNGEIVVGSKPGAPGNPKSPIYQTWLYGNDNKYAWATTDSTQTGTVQPGSLSEYITLTVTTDSAKNSSLSMSEFLQNKIGYHDNDSGKNYGMCMSVLNSCQDVTYKGTGQNATYQPVNNVIKEFLNRTLIQIKASQDSILADYAENCITDVAACLAQNNYDADKNTKAEGSNTVTLSSGNKLAIKACNSIITTCMSVNDVNGTPSTASLSADEWIIQIME